jgi:hypothetical protein
MSLRCELGCACDADCLVEEEDQEDEEDEEDPGDGLATTCAVTIAPETGSTETAFAAELESNGTACRGTYDAIEPGPVACSAAPIPFLGADIGVGSHTVTLFVDEGPGGPAQCSSAFTVTAATSCSVVVSPEHGTAATAFAAELESNGTACRATYDDVEPGPIDCAAAAIPFLGSDIGVGSHTVKLFVDAGPSGPRECSAIFTVDPT